MKLDFIKKFLFLLKQQMWTHVVLPFYTIFILSFIIATLYDITIHDFYLSYFVILCGATLCPYLICITIFIIILFKLLSIKFKNINKTNNKVLLQNPAYNILWLIGMFALLFNLYFFVFRYLPAIF